MGYGDELMAAGQARRAGVRCAIGGRDGNPRWHELWEGNPLIARPGEKNFEKWIANCPGRRPYIKAKTPQQWTWREFQPTPAALYFTPAELRMKGLAGDCVVIEPHIKSKASPNKRWEVKRWQALIDLAPDIPWVQLGNAPTLLRGVRHVYTSGMREACAVLSGAAAAVVHEGGLHHAAAAVNVPAVVIYGGYISPKVTGYEMHRNLFTGGAEHPLGCGMRQTCVHCMRAMDAITPEQVLHELKEILSGQHEADRRRLVAAA